jgi:hypothetical protein
LGCCLVTLITAILPPVTEGVLCALPERGEEAGEELGEGGAELVRALAEEEEEE